MAEARKFAKKIRVAIDRGVSDSLILEHLPAAAREQFGHEMIAQTRTGQRLGAFGQKVDEAIESRQAEIIEGAVRVQSGIDVTVMENEYGISLSQTLMNLAENSLRDKNAEEDGRVEESEEAGYGTSQEEENAEERDVSEAVKEAQAYVLDHLHNKPEHEQQLTADDARRMLSLINPNNEMRVIPQRDSSSLAFIAENPSGGWDCIVIAPRRGEFYIFKTVFAQKRKPYQDMSLIRYSVGLAERGNAVGSLIRGLLTSVRDIGPRFSINPNLRADVEAALNTDRNSGRVEKGELRVNFCDAPPLFTAIGLSTGKIYSKAYILWKIAKEHNLSSEQIASAPKLLESPAVVFDDHGKGYIFLTETVAMDEDEQLAPVMFYLGEDAEGNFIARAYARKEKVESKYVNLVNAGKVLYFDKNKVTRLPLRGEAQSSLNTFNAGDKVVTQNRATFDNLSQTPGAVNEPADAADVHKRLQQQQLFSSFYLSLYLFTSED